METGYRRKLAQVSLLMVLGFWFGWYLWVGEQYFWGPFVAWVTIGIVYLLWLLTGKPFPEFPRKITVWLSIMVTYLFLHTFFYATSPYLWKFSGTNMLLALLGIPPTAGLLLKLKFSRPHTIFILTIIPTLTIFVMLAMGVTPFRHRISLGFAGCLIFITGLVQFKITQDWIRYANLCLAGMGLGIIVFVRSRSGLFVLFSLIVWEFMQKYRIFSHLKFHSRVILILISIALTIGVSYFFLEWSQHQGFIAFARYQFWKAETLFILEHPWGIGLGHASLVLPSLSPAQENPPVRYEKLLDHAHQQYLSLGMELGIPALLGVIYAIFITIQALHRVENLGSRYFLTRGFYLMAVWGLFQDVFSYQFQVGVLVVFVAFLWSRQKIENINSKHPVVLTFLLIFYLGCGPFALSNLETALGQGQIQERPVQARQYFTRAIHLWRDNAWAHKRMADTFELDRSFSPAKLDEGRFPRLHHRFQALVLAPGDRVIAQDFARDWSSLCMLDQESMACTIAKWGIEQYLKIVPHDVFMLYQWAILASYDHPSSSVHFLKRALDYEPHFAQAWYALYWLQCASTPQHPCSTPRPIFRKIRTLLLEHSYAAETYEGKVLTIPPIRTLLHPGTF